MSFHETIFNLTQPLCPYVYRLALLWEIVSVKFGVSMTQSERSWDLSVLVDGATAGKVKELLDTTVIRANELAEKYGSKISSMSASILKRC